MDLERTVNSYPRRNLPSVDRLIRKVEAKANDLAGWAVRSASKSVLERVRAEMSLGENESSESSIEVDELAYRALAEAVLLATPHPRAVLNATGVLLHTNLGRAPLAPAAQAAVARVARGY